MLESPHDIDTVHCVKLYALWTTQKSAHMDPRGGVEQPQDREKDSNGREALSVLRVSITSILRSKAL